MPNSIAQGVAYKDPEFQSLSIKAPSGVTATVGFYGVTPVAQATTISAVATTASSSTTNAFGYTTSTQADALVTAVNSMLTALKNIGIVAA